MRMAFVLLSLLVSWSASAQVKNAPAFVSAVDRELDLRSVVVVPFADNVSDIYGAPLTIEARRLLENDPQWTLVEPNWGTIRRPGLESRPDDVRTFLKNSKADGFLSARITKGPGGLQMKLQLFVGPSGLPLLIEDADFKEGFQIELLQQSLAEMMARLKTRMPYSGSIRSRNGGDVTLEPGKNMGLRDGDEVAVIQILKVNRHPRFQFLVSTEKEILGRLKIIKADDALSFGRVMFEKEAGVIAPGQKVLLDRTVSYPAPADGTAMPDRRDAPVAFGEKPIEWLPESSSQFGRVQISAGLSSFDQSVAFNTKGTITGNNSFAPNLGLEAEGWLSREWYIAFALRQSAFKLKNDLSGSSPDTINMATSKYDLAFGRTFLLSPDFFGPKIQLGLGLEKMTFTADESTPALFTTMSYGGTFLGFTFLTPLSDEIPWELGARMKFHLAESVDESVSSGSTGDVHINDFSFLIARKVRQNFRYVGEANFETYSADFKGKGERPAGFESKSTTQKIITLMVGLEYLF